MGFELICEHYDSWVAKAEPDSFDSKLFDLFCVAPSESLVFLIRAFPLHFRAIVTAGGKNP